MPDTLRELYDSIIKEGNEQGLSGPQRIYAVGWIFYDVFERAEHDEKKGVTVTATHLDGYASQLPDRKIARDVEEAEEEFGRVAAAFMDEEIQNRIKEAIDNSILTHIKSYTGGMKTFIWNVVAGITSGIVFAIILLIFAKIYEKDPSPIALEKEMLKGGAEHRLIDPPVAPPPSLAQPTSRGKT